MDGKSALRKKRLTDETSAFWPEVAESPIQLPDASG